MCEIGPDIPKFRSAATFASWLGLCPPNTISGGMVPERKNPPGEEPTGGGILHGGQRVVRCSGASRRWGNSVVACARSIRKHMGFGHISARHAEEVDQFHGRYSGCRS
jgi:hypothetical protein